MSPSSVRRRWWAVSLLNPSRNLDGVAAMKAAGVTGFALELVPRITRAQGMDVAQLPGDGGGVPCRRPGRPN